MNEPTSRFSIIASKMMRGLNGNDPTDEQFEEFKERNKDIIVWVDNALPHELADRMISIGVLGAVGKGVLWYGKEKMEPFCAALGHGHFNGEGDPAHILWLWLTGRSKYNHEMAYRKTVATIRAYMSGKQLVRKNKTIYLDPAGTDLFEWDSTFTIMLKNKNCKKNKTYKAITPKNIQLAEKEVEEALAELKKQHCEKQ